MVKDLINKTKLYFGEMNHINSLFFETNLIEYCLYCYFLCAISLLMSQNTFDGEYVDEILSNLINNMSKSLNELNINFNNDKTSGNYQDNYNMKK